MTEHLGNGTLLDGLTIVVTGANRGIGLQLTEMCISNGATVIACTREPSEKVKSLVRSARGYKPDELLEVHFDFADLLAVKEAAKLIAQNHSRIDVIINNAGVAMGGLFQMVDISAMKRLFDVNFFHQLAFTQILCRRMGRINQGSIINISSSSAFKNEPGTLSYSASKTSLIQATKVMASELGKFNIRVNAIAPGVVETDMLREMNEADVERHINESAWSRVTKVEEVANVALFLASYLSDSVTGQVIRVDGGR